MTFEDGKYKELFAHPDLQRALGTIKSVSRKTGIEYAIVGGGAVYLHSNPPEDSPDLDVMLGTNSDGARVFVKELVAADFKVSIFDVSENDDAFAITTYRGIQIDLFTDQSELKYVEGAVTVQGLRVKAIEPLVIEKLFRATHADLLAAIDLLNCGSCDRKLLFALAGEKNLRMLLVKTMALANALSRKLLTKQQVRRSAKKLSSGTLSW